MVYFRKPVEKSEDIIDLRDQPGAQGRAVNRKKRRLAEEIQAAAERERQARIQDSRNKARRTR